MAYHKHLQGIIMIYVLQTSCALGENLFSGFEKDPSIAWVQNDALGLCAARLHYEISQRQEVLCQ